MALDQRQHQISSLSFTPAKSEMDNSTMTYIVVQASCLHCIALYIVADWKPCTSIFNFLPVRPCYQLKPELL